MNSQVVCLVRSGEAGRETQQQAIHYAKTAGKELVFLHIIDLASYEIENEELRDSVHQELTWLARINLSQARQRAQRHGLKANIAIRNGTFFQTVTEYVRENPVNRLFIGLPRESQDEGKQRLERVQAFARRFTETTGVEVVIA